MINAAALRFLGYTSANELTGKEFKILECPLAEEIDRLPKDTTDTIRLSDSMIYRCSRLSFVDRGFAHPFVLIESLTAEVVKAEKKAYEKVIRMIAHEVNNTTAGITGKQYHGRYYFHAGNSKRGTERDGRYGRHTGSYEGMCGTLLWHEQLHNQFCKRGKDTGAKS